MLLALACGTPESPATGQTSGQTEVRQPRAEASTGETMCRSPENDCAIPPDVERVADAQSIVGQDLEACSTAPLTGFRRTGRCETGPEDRGVHVVCGEMTEAFLTYTQQAGNDLSSPRPEYGFPGLVPGDRWCLCAARWAEASAAGVAPPVVLEATEDTALRTIARESLEAHAVR